MEQERFSRLPTGALRKRRYLTEMPATEHVFQIGWLHFDIKQLPDGRYSVSFLSHARCGLSGSVELQRFAEYQDGVLQLDRPVQELNKATYAKLFSVRVKGQVYLVPAPRVIEFDNRQGTPPSSVLAQSWGD